MVPWALGGGPNKLVGPAAGDDAVLGLERGAVPTVESEGAGADVPSQGTVVDVQAVDVVEVAHCSPRASAPNHASLQFKSQPMAARWLNTAGPHSSGSVAESDCKHSKKVWVLA